MSALFDPGDALVFMKVGTHANEELADIIERKRKEIADAGFAMWGYGGNTCHPRTMVQPFAQAHASSPHPIRLCMQRMTSRHFAEKLRADAYSADGLTWQEIPSAINVLGSRYALCIKSLVEVKSSLVLGETTVAVGRSKGRLGSAYVKGHVDKACLEFVGGPQSEEAVSIDLIADLVEPYAVFLK